MFFFQHFYSICNNLNINIVNASSLFSFSVGNEQLRGASLEDRAQVLQWLSFGDSEILPPACTWIFPLLGIIQYNKQVCLFSS